jgi:hypothetical protein
LLFGRDEVIIPLGSQAENLLKLIKKRATGYINFININLRGFRRITSRSAGAFFYGIFKAHGNDALPCEQALFGATKDCQLFGMDMEIQGPC